MTGVQTCALPISKARGSGIGLAVCDEIIRLHEGTFTIGNAEGGGCVVTITLPAE